MSNRPPCLVNFSKSQKLNCINISKSFVLCCRLQILADRIVDKFVSVGLMKREYDRVKLHVTLMNTLMRKDPNDAFVSRGFDRRGIMKDRESFDANGVFRVCNVLPKSKIVY